MYKTKKLKNGLKCISVPMKGTRTATVLVLVGAGSKYENRKNNGVSHFLEHMFFKGTKNRPNAIDITSELDSVGAEFNAFTSKEFTGYWVKIDSSKLSIASDVVSDMLLNSKFEQEEIDRERGVILEEMNMYHENPMMYIEDVFEECLYGDTPAGWEVIGTKGNILSMNREDFVDYFEKNYRPDNTVVCLAGNIDDAIEDKIFNYFLELKEAPENEKEEISDIQSEPNILIKNKETQQANLSLGVRTFSINHENELIVKLISVILGGSMSSRLFSELREKRGLAYYVRTQAEFYTDSGYLTTQAGVPTEKTEEAMEIILREYKKLKEEEVSKEELQRAKDLIKGRLIIQHESSDDVALWHARQEVVRGKQLTPEEFIERINQIKPSDVRKVAKEIFVDKGLNLALIGSFLNEGKIKETLKFA